MKRDRLGKGLGALLGDYLAEEEEVSDVRSVPVSAIVPNPFQPRREFSEEELADLTSSIRENGLLQPIVVRPTPGEDGGWELVAGERRWRAVTRLGWHEVPAIVRRVDDRTLLVLALVENLQRAELAPLDEAAGYRQLADEFGLSQQQIADTVGRDRTTISNALRLLQLPASVRQLLDQGKLTAGHARALLGVSDPGRMVDLARHAAAQGWSVREVEARVQRGRPPAPSSSRNRVQPGTPAERRLEEELQRALGTAVKLRRSRGAKGRIEIPFYDADDFERIYEMLVGRPVTEVVS